MITYGDLNATSMLSTNDWNRQNGIEAGANVALATLVDVGTSMYNSLVPESWETSTRGLLQSIGADGAVAAYDNNRDLVNTLSFVGGVFIPGMAATKLARGIRAGIKGTGILGDLRHKEDLVKFQTLIENGMEGTAEYRKMRNGIFARGQAANLIDTAAAEVAIMGTFNAHPFMEDYLEDPLKNFGIGLLIGGGIGGGINFLTTRSALAGVLGNAQAGALNTVREAAGLNAASFADSSSAITALDNSASKLEAMAKSDEFNPLTKEFASSFARSMRENIGTLFKGSASERILAESELAQTAIRDRLATPQFFGVDEVDFLKLPAGGYKQPEELNVEQQPIFKKIIGAGTDKQREKFIRNAYYSPELGGFVKRADTLLASTAADVFTPSELAKATKKLTRNRLTNSWGEAQALERTADVEAAYLTNMSFYSKLSSKDLAGVEMVHGDYPAIQGWVSAHNERMADVQLRLRDMDPLDKGYRAALDELAVLRDAKLKVFSGDRVRLVNVEEIAEGALPTAANTLDPSSMVKPTFFHDVEKEIMGGAVQPLMNRRTTYATASQISYDFYNYVGRRTGIDVVGRNGALHDIAPSKLEAIAKDFAAINEELLKDYVSTGADLTAESSLMLIRWIGGRQEDKELFRNAMASARTLRKNLDSTTPFHEALSNILNSPLVKQQADMLSRHADAKGNIYLKRGMTRGSDGDVTVSSYTFNENIARGFGQVGTYKVAIDDVVGYLYAGEAEWLVGATTRDATEFAQATKATQQKHIPPQPKSTGFKDLNPAQAQELLLTTKGDEIYRAIQGGMAPEVAALRFNVGQEFVEMAGSDPDAFTKLFNYSADGKFGPNTLNTISRWKGAADIEAALDPARRTLRVSASEQKVMGESGQLLAQHHDALRGTLNLSRLQKAALESMDSAATERLNSKVAIQDELMSTIQRNWVETSVLAGKSVLLKKMYGEVVDSGEIKALRDGLNQFVNGRGGNPLYSSADFVTSRMGEVGRFVTDIGDMRGKIANKEFERLATPVANEFKKLMQDEAARTEFAVFDNLRQSHRGFAKYSPADRTFVTVAEDGTTSPITEFTVRSDVVDRALTYLDEAGSAIYDNQATLNRIKGSPEPSNIGTWIPSQLLSNKELAYVVNHDDGSIKLLVGNTPEDLKTVTKAYSLGQNESILTRAELGQDRIARVQDTLQNLERADVTKLKKGTGLAAPDISSDRLADIINGLRDRINYQASAFVESSLTDVMNKLDYLSDFNTKYFANNNPNIFRRAVQQLGTQDTARDIKDILLGRNSVYRNEFLGTINKATSATIQIGLNAWNRAYEATLKPALTKSGELKPGARVDYDGFMGTLKAQGIDDPFKAFNEAARPLLYERAKNSGYSVTPDRLVNAGNALASTLALKFAEIAQPLVNMMSAPILGMSTISRSIKAVSAETGRDIIKDSPIAVMTAGIRRAHSDLPENKRFLKLFEEEGLFDPIISEADEVIKLSRFGTGSFVGGLEKALDSSFVKVMSRPSEASESLLRKYTLMTGVDLGRRLYGPAASDRQLAIFARDFMKQSLGNYTTSQRPMMFQGTFGSAMGLFQTYMLTYAQSMYRHLDMGDYKGLGKTMLLQGGIFGAGSLPGFQPISHAIGEHFSDEHWDLTTGTYRALPDYMADMLIYGLPSNLAPDVHTRGDVSPRVPGSISTMVAPSMIMQSFDTLFRTGKAMLQQDIGAGQAFMEALATQSVSRPIARMSELVTGRTITGQGNQVAGPEEVWSWQGILARVASTRTLAESKTREAMHLNSYYGAIDSEARAAVLGRMRTAIRAGNLDNTLMDELAYSYLRVGTPQGFRQAVNQALMEQETTKMIDLTSKLRTSPLMSILDDID